MPEKIVYNPKEDAKSQKNAGAKKPRENCQVQKYRKSRGLPATRNGSEKRKNRESSKVHQTR
jgi:23S rRNA maturation mini-RNase III